jgi:mono/diheme cytochrome c family protein
VGVRHLAVRGVSAPRSARRGLARAVCVLALAAGACDANAPGTGGDPQVAYLRDAASRRRALVDSLVNPANRYSQLRLARYATGAADDWERLDAWNPLVAPVAASALDAAPPLALPADARALELPDDATWDPSMSLVALGEEAFFRYPAQLAPTALTPLTRDAAQRYGLWLDGTRGVGGVVAVEVAGGTALALSCASCHADVVGGRLVPGLPSAHLDLGSMIYDSAAIDDVTSSNLLAWGPGRNDVTTSDASLPERVSDLRPLRFLSHLQYDATVRQLDVVSLAVRIETLLITSHGQAIRPPRIVALAIAQYLWSLADGLPAAPVAETPGRALFAARCSGCHAGDGLTSAPRPLAEIGTDPRLGLSLDRGTGLYRVPSLRGVGERPTLFHDGTLPDLDALLDPQRLDAGYAGGARGAGPVNGHAFGLDLSPSERAALLDYVRSL